MTPDDIARLLVTDRAAGTAALDDALTTLHGSAHAAHLCALHRVAADYWSTDPDRVAFHLTHAWIYALEAGDEGAEAELHDLLAREGRI
jgi:hypothetical protein